PRVRAGTLKIPSASSRRLTVLADLRLPPLAAYNRNLFSAISTTGLNVRSSSSRAYLARLARAQRVAAAELRRAIPSARIAYRYRVVMDGFAVSLPARKLPALAHLPAVTKIYPSVRYELDTNRSPAVIGAGDAGTNVGPGLDHPAVAGLSGIAPRAWLGSYRVFNTPTPMGYDAFTPQIVAAFEAAVNDGMDVINFSGGGPEADPVSDALVEAVHNVANAGVVPVISAGNDRDDWGLGSVGSPGTAPDAISVAAVSNSHVFAPSLSLTTSDAPATLKNIPFADNEQVPGTWTTADQTLADVGTIVGTDGRPVERHLCGPASDPNTGRSGIVTSFSSAGPTDFGHRLKPDVAAPGGQILSATLPEALGEPFAVFDGTSMSAPHVTGAVALLVARHPSWTPAEVKSAL